MSKSLLRSIGLLSLILGVVVIGYFAYPIVSYEITAARRFPGYLSPVPAGEKKNVLTETIETSRVDYTRASAWFADGKRPSDFEVSGITYYTITIPKLNIYSAPVSVGGENLADSIIQYPGTALPGERGNSVLFGHSILPQFYNPKDPISIFSLLPELDVGDRYEVNFDGITYRYEVAEMFEVKPTDVHILEQTDTEPFMSLVTCTPPGHPLRPKRLIVRSKLIPHDGQNLTANFQ